MSVLLCPHLDEEPWPTLGPYVVQFIEEQLCHGPGDLLGKRVVLNREQKAWIYRMYEVEPAELVSGKRQVMVRSANPRAGRRRFQRCALSLRKGSCKTEFAAWIAAVELHPDGPVRCDGFESKRGPPVPMPVSDPYIPMISYSEEQTEELAYGALRRMLLEVPLGHDFDIGLERIMRLNGAGKAEAVSASPNARDGARTTFQHADETHRFTLDSLKDGWKVMLANLAKRPLADPWALETTTAPEPGGGSVAESTMEYARAVMAGRAKHSRLFFYHREAGDHHDISSSAGLRSAIVEASGPFIAAWTDVDRIAASFDEPDADRPYLERVWLNRLVQSSGRAFDIERWRALKKPDFQVPGLATITLGFDGARYDDQTALVAVHVETGHIWPVRIWSPPRLHARMSQEQRTEIEQGWLTEIDGVVADVFARYHVARMYCDPPKWEGMISKWAGEFGMKRVSEWWTNRPKQMAYAIRAFVTAIGSGDCSHAGDPELDQHIGNARREPTNLVDDEERPLWVIRKERPDSPKKIDAVTAAVLAWEACNDAIAAGEIMAEPQIYFVG